MQHLLAIDCGTSSTRAFIFTAGGTVAGSAQAEITQYYPQDGWVEQDADEIWRRTLAVCQQALQRAQLPASALSACGITNQRETVVLWDKKTHQVCHRAIVWQDRRTAPQCRALQSDPKTVALLQHTTGLLADPYFSATKIQWLLTHHPELSSLAKKGRLAFGTIDSFLLWRLSGGKTHATDASNASRTLLFNIHQQCWDKQLLQLFNIPANILPTVLDSNATFATMNAELLGSPIPITGIAGDQQAALIGQACLQAGMLKATYGTGGFLLLNTGKTAVKSQHRLLTTIAYRINNEVTYGLEGSIFNTGTSIKWLCDDLGILSTPAASETLAQQVSDNGDIYFIPAFTGLGAPHWQPDARGLISGLTRGTQAAHLVRAALEAVAYQTLDILQVITKDYGSPIRCIRVDGGMTQNTWLLQFLADMLQQTIEPTEHAEVTALGAALLAGVGAGIFATLSDAARLWHAQKSYLPDMAQSQRKALYHGWQQALKKVV